MKKNEDHSENVHLRKDIGMLEAITVVIGIVIGSGIFFKSSPVFGQAGSVWMGLAAWIVGGIVTMASALTVAEIGAAIPKTGGVFVYLKELYNEKWAFLYGWVQTLVYAPGIIAALSIVFATQATYFIPMSPKEQKGLAVFIMVFIILINIVSTRLGSRVQIIVTFAKLVPIFVIILFGLWKGQAHSLTAAAPMEFHAAGFGAAILGTLWAYDGWVHVSNMAGEMKNAKTDLPRAIVIGLSMIILIYLLINMAIIQVLPFSEVVSSPKVASDTAVQLFGNSGAGFITAGIMISIIGALNGYIMTGIRIPYAMSRDGLFPFSSIFSRLHGTFKTPANILILEGLLAFIYLMTGSFETLTNLAIFVTWIFFVMTVAGIFILRYKFKHVERPYQVPLFPVVPIIGIAGGIYIIISTFFTSTLDALIGIFVTIIGIPVYYAIKRKEKSV
ncbi:APC family permease [Ectobacillus polymachus]|uniref:APC family permease n=1 Tax=Ectobacillus polymachus TaxID=1508806 RepID=UPI003A854256